METPLLRTPSPVQAGGFGQVAPPPHSPRERLAILAPSSKLCGVSAYADALQRQLGEAFDITVFDLNQYLLRSQHRRVRQLADRHIKEICRELRRFDVVNLQLEHGTLGRSGKDIYRRFRWLTAAAPRLSVTFHSLHLPASFDAAAVCRDLLRLRFRDALRRHAEYRRNHFLSAELAAQLRRLQRHKQVSAIVHNRRDLSEVRYLYGIRNVFDHPLSYLSTAEVAAVRRTASRASFPMLDGLPQDAVLFGVFGFLNEYKGIRTAIQALHYQPPNHHLLIFGGVHPQEIAPGQQRHPYISSLFGEAYMDATLYDHLGSEGDQKAAPLVVGADQGLRELLGAHPRDLSGRIHFMGALDESDFLRGMAICDAVVFPYLEVGQSSSGPISQALELGCRIIASRTHTFREFAEYHKDAVEFFDIGNHLELAERLLARPQHAPRDRLPDFNIETNKATYLLANSRISGNRSRPRNGLVRIRAAAPAAPTEPK